VESELVSRPARPSMNTSKRRSDSSRLSGRGQREPSDEFSDDELDDADLLQAARGVSDLDFTHIDNFGTEIAAQCKKNTLKNAHQIQPGKARSVWQPTRLRNGKWACNHACKDKTACKHMCCREGVDKPPKAPKKWVASANAENQNSSPKVIQIQKKLSKGQTTLNVPGMKIGKFINRSPSSTVEQMDLTDDPTTKLHVIPVPEGLKQLQRLDSTFQKDKSNYIPSLLRQNASRSPTNGAENRSSFLPRLNTKIHVTLSEYGDSWPDDSDLPDLYQADDTEENTGRRLKPPLDLDPIESEIENDGPVMLPVGEGETEFGNADSMLNAALVGLADSQDLQASRSFEATGGSYVDNYQTNADDVLTFPETPRKPSSQNITVFLASESSVPASEPPHQEHAVRNPILKTSSPFFTVTHTVKRPSSSKETMSQAERPLKRVKRIHDCGAEKTPLLNHASNTKAPASKPFNERDENEDSPKPEGADEWLMQEFGQYVDFV
jgi:ATP-dependent DNA helicase HFM1/MER3